MTTNPIETEEASPFRVCPFCGAPPISLQICEDADENLFVECMRCGATGPTKTSGFVWDDRAVDAPRTPK